MIQKKKKKGIYCLTLMLQIAYSGTTKLLIYKCPVLGYIDRKLKEAFFINLIYRYTLLPDTMIYIIFQYSMNISKMKYDKYLFKYLQKLGNNYKF